MKKILVLSLAMIALGACNNREVKNENSDIKLLKIQEKGTFAKINVLGNQATTKDLKTDVKIQDNLFAINVENISENVIVIQWNKARYIGLDKKEQRLYDLKNRELGIYESEVMTMRPGQSYQGNFVPVKNLKFLSQSQANKEVIYGRKDLFTGDEERNQKRDYAEIVVPVTVEGIDGITQTFSFYIGKGDSQLLIKDLENEISSKKNSLIKTQTVRVSTKANAPILSPLPEASPETATKIQQVQEDNTKLKAEIEAREKLLQYLKEQEILKKQLAEKEAEIQKLLKTTKP